MLHNVLGSYLTVDLDFFASLEQHQFLLQLCLALYTVLLRRSHGRRCVRLQFRLYLGLAVILALLLLLRIFLKDLYIKLILVFIILLELLELLLETAGPNRGTDFLLGLEFDAVLPGDDDRPTHVEVLLLDVFLLLLGQVDAVDFHTVGQFDALDIALLLVDIDERLLLHLLLSVEWDVELLAIGIGAVFQQQGETVVLLDVLLDLPSNDVFHFVVAGVEGVAVLGGEEVGVEVLAALGLLDLDLLALLGLLVLDEHLAGTGGEWPGYTEGGLEQTHLL